MRQRRLRGFPRFLALFRRAAVAPDDVGRGLGVVPANGVTGGSSADSVATGGALVCGVPTGDVLR